VLIDCVPGETIHYSYEEIQNPDLLDYAKENFSLEGSIKSANSESYYYLKIDDDFIFKLFPLIKKNNHSNLQLPGYFSGEKKAGAHITVAYEEEWNKSMEMLEIDKIYSFELDKLIKLSVFNKIIYAIVVRAKELEELRQKYGLPIQLNYHGLLVPFHITIGVAK
jgi:hypothetical protein